MSQELYTRLAKLRLQLAQQAKAPAFIVFSNQTLVHMAQILPKTQETFLTIPGVGPIKWKKYGQFFLDVIIDYCKENERAPVEKKENSTPALASLLEQMLDFYQKRNWEQFHSPKNLVMDLTSEMGELAELFRWLTEEQSYYLDAEIYEEVRDEIGDIFKTLIYLAYKLGINPIEASSDKLLKMEEKYPVQKSYGKSLKYTQYTNQ